MWNKVPCNPRQFCMLCCWLLIMVAQLCKFTSNCLMYFNYSVSVRCGRVRLVVTGRDYQVDCLVLWRLSKCYLYTSGNFHRFLLWVFKGCDEQVSNFLTVSVADAARYVPLYRRTRGVCMATWNLDTSCYQRSLGPSGRHWLCSSGCGMKFMFSVRLWVLRHMLAILRAWSLWYAAACWKYVPFKRD